MQLKHQRKADIDAVRGVFELPINSKMADLGHLPFLHQTILGILVKNSSRFVVLSQQKCITLQPIIVL